jgi:hypothetical protein
MFSAEMEFPMLFTVAVNAYPATPNVTALRNHLLATVWGNAGAPAVFVVTNVAMAAGQIAASYDGTGHKITITHNAAADEDILDYLLFEVSNVLNPKIAQASALPKIEPVDNVGAARAAAEYDTLKAYVHDLQTVFAPAGFAALLAGAPNLPAQALSTITSWVNQYEPIYAAYNIPPAQAFAVQPLAALLPLPAAAPPVVAGGAPQPIPAEQAAIVQFASTPHNPGANPASDSFYLALLTTRQVYAFERPRGWQSNQMSEYLKAIAPLQAAAGNIVSDQVYRPFRAAWGDEIRYRTYLFATLMPLLQAQYAAAIAPRYVFDPATVLIARQEAARAIASRYQSADMSKVLPMKAWLTSDVALRTQVNVILAAAGAPAVILANIK